MDKQNLISYLRNNRQVALLLSISAMAMVLLTFRILNTRSLGFYFLVWNLFLAWTPLLFIKMAWNIDRVKMLPGWALYLSLLVWLLFFPNAPYIITDLKHLRGVPENMIWYDAILLFSFALSGLLTGLYSIRIVFRLLKRRFSQPASWLLVLLFMSLSGFGIFLGRFGRWNSWDIITQPDALAKGVFLSLTDPLAIKHTATFSFVLMLLYLAFHIFAEINNNEPANKYFKNAEKL
tara:strand:- start:95 stop:799 length:705 start_codon:yes stop_codon:yes gene_type:complete